jgi:hypothetical protein
MKKTPVDFTGRIRVTANVHDLDLDRYFIEVEFRHIDGRTATTTLPRGIIKSGNCWIVAPFFPPGPAPE